MYLVWASGCGAGARSDLAASDALLAIADQMETAVAEYHAEISDYDHTREAAVASALVDRIKHDVDDEAALDAHVADFHAALAKVREDRNTEWRRRAAALDNVSVLREVAQGLRSLAINRLTLDDEMRRYLDAWIETRGGERDATGTVIAAEE